MELFYCYSKRMMLFLRSMNMKYISYGKNRTAGTIFWTFEKSDRLDELIALWNDIKYK